MKYCLFGYVHYPLAVEANTVAFMKHISKIFNSISAGIADIYEILRLLSIK